MVEYIDKAKLYEIVANLEELARNELISSVETTMFDKFSYSIRLQERTALKHLIADFETVDVAPVVHGKWLTDTQEVDGCIKCSVCGIELDKYIIGRELPEYCLCGAKMDLE